MKITLELEEHGWMVSAKEDGKPLVWADSLSRDEALGTVAEIIYTKNAHYLKTYEQHRTWDAQYRPGHVTVLR
jgi:hypothetical protein